MSNLFKMVTGLMSDGMVGKVASLIGSNAGVTKTALTALMPNILKGIASKGATESGASSLLSMIKNHGLGGNVDMSAGMMDKGGKMNEAIFGSSMKDISVPGLGGEAKSKLMNLATPLAMGSLGKLVKDKNLDAKGLSTYLSNEVKGTAGATTARAKDTVSRATSTASSAATQTASGGLGFLKWALPLLLILGGIWYFLNMKGDKAATPVKETTTTQPAKTNQTKTATHTHSDGTVHQGATHGDAVKEGAGKMMDKAKGAAGAVGEGAGDMMDKAKGAAGAVGDGAGKMMDKAKGAAGAVGDGAGDVLDKAKEAAMDKAKGAAEGAGNMLDKAKGAADAVGGAAGKVGGATGDAVKGAADKAGDVLDAAKKNATKGGGGK